MNSIIVELFGLWFFVGISVGRISVKGLNDRIAWWFLAAAWGCAFMAWMVEK